MSLAVVQAKSNQVVSASCAVTISTTAGNLLVAIAYSDLASTVTFTITDSLGQTWTTVTNTPLGVGNARMQMWCIPNSGAVTSVTVTCSSSGTLPVVVYEISGAAASSPLDPNASNAVTVTGLATATSLASGSLNTSNANDILLYAVGENANTSGWSDTVNGFAIPSGGSIASGRAAIAFKIVSATQSGATTTMSWTTTGADRVGILAAFQAAAAAVFVPDDADAQSQFSQATRTESQHQQELSETFAILPLPPFSVQEEFAESLCVDWRALQHQDDDSAFPPTPPFSILDEHQDQRNVSWSAIQYDDAETHWVFPPVPPAAVQDEISERALPGIVPFFEEDQAGKPIVIAPAPNIGLDDIEAHVKAFDRVGVYHEDDWSTTAPAPPFAFEDDLKTISQTPTYFSITDMDLVGTPPVPSRFWDDEEPLQRYMVGGLSALIVLDEFVNAPVVNVLGPASLASLFAAVRPAIASLGVAVRPGIDSLGIAVRPAINSLGVAVRPAMDSQGAAVRPAIDSQGGTVRPS